MRVPILSFIAKTWRLPPVPRFRVLRNAGLSEWLFRAVFPVYLLAAVVVFFEFVNPWINGEIEIRIGADSDRYWEAARYGFQSFSLSGNFLGPTLLVLLLKSGLAILCFNVLLFWLALEIASSIEGVKAGVFGFLMLLNAELFPALTTLNKEILALLAAVLTAKYIYSGGKIVLLSALAVSFLARWEQAAILILFLVLRRFKPKVALAGLIAALTVIYPLMFTIFGLDPSMFDYLLEGGNTILTLNHIQNMYGFPLVLLPKVAMLVAGKLATPWFYWSGEFLDIGFADVQQQVFQPLGSFALIVVLAVAFFKGKMNLHRPVAFLVAITMVVTAITPFIQPRYLYAVYVLLSLEIARTCGRSSYSFESSDLRSSASG